MKINLFPRKALCLVLIVGFFSLIPMAAQAETMVIVNPEVSESSLSAKDLKAAFTNKLPKWSDGTKINIIILEDGKTNKEFLKKYIKKSPKQFKSYWKKQVFSGKAIMPKSTKKVDELVKLVASIPGAIGFIDSSTPVEGVKILTIQ